MIREFLLTNLISDPRSSSLGWRANLSGIQKFLNEHLAKVYIGGDCQSYNGPALFLGGGNSNYIT